MVTHTLSSTCTQLRLVLGEARSVGRPIGRAQAEEALAHQALHDPLTTLPNRTLLHDRLQQAILAARRDGTALSFLLMDLDRFKEVNDTFGHHYGDLLLQQLAARLQTILRESDTVARLGGDEFGLLLPGTTAMGATWVADKLLMALEQPFVLEGHSFVVEASIGITAYPQHGEDVTTLLRRADIAMYGAKRAGGGYALYTPGEDQHGPRRLALMADLRAAIAHDQLLLHFQPQVDLATGCTRHVEALVRWKHPQHGFMPPDHFIPLAEQSGLIRPLTRWVLDAALRTCHEWHGAGLDVNTAVNLSARSLDDLHLAGLITELLATWGLTPCALTVEVTESALMVDSVRAMQVLTGLHDLGVRIAIDDFGTGYSSLSHLRRLPVDEIKIDKSFVVDMAAREDNALIVRSIIDLAHHRDLAVVAEGVETLQIRDLLAGLGCDMAQGYGVSRPLPAADLTRWLQESHWRLAPS
jgi:diguanylate cyclase (GGDEF)-like protein